MTITAKVILDSMATNGARLITFELTYPRFIHSELMTHRVFSRNAASSRAIPTPKKIERIREDCAKPSEWGINQKGMVAIGPLSEKDATLAEKVWSLACHAALAYAEALCGLTCPICFVQCSYADHPRLDLHKQVANRILEPYDHIVVVLSTTKINNHFLLRLATDPQTGRPLPDPTYFELAMKWKAAMDASTPYKMQSGEWHLPYISYDTHWEGEVKRVFWSDEDDAAVRHYIGDTMQDLDASLLQVMKSVSAARCARVSYLRQGQGDISENIILHDRLAKGGHWAPLEHVATPIDDITFQVAAEQGSCDWCLGEIKKGSRIVTKLYFDEGYDTICMKCAYGHVHSGNLHGWAQYRKEFANEAGGD